MEPEVNVEEYFGGPVYALVIGISNYQFGYASNESPIEKGFRKLNYAEKDANDFSDYLSRKGVFDTSIFKCINEKATLKDIKKEFNRLIDSCNKSDTSNPLVIIFFSGHGEADEQDHYFITYDAERTELDATTLTNNAFNNYLKRLKTSKVVVFLDACFSGGATDNDAKGNESYFDPNVLGTDTNTDKVLGTGTGRYVIASCDRNEFSYEGDKGHGIFTQCLLELLNCEGENIIEEEEINTNNLYEKLRKNVLDIAKSKNKIQTPTWSIGSGQHPIKLGVNLKVKEARLLKENSASKKQVEFQEKIFQVALMEKYSYRYVFEDALKGCINKEIQEEKYYKFYELYNEVYAIYLGNTTAEWILQKAYKLLCNCFTEIILPQDTQAKPVESAPLISRMPVQPASNSIVTENKIDKVGDDNFVERGTKIQVSESYNQKSGATQVSNAPLRRLSDEAATYILQPIYEPKFFMDYRRFSDCLNQQVITAKQFMDVLTEIHKKRKGESELMAILQKIAERFQEKWEKAEIVAIKTATEMMLKR